MHVVTSLIGKRVEVQVTTKGKDKYEWWEGLFHECLQINAQVSYEALS